MTSRVGKKERGLQYKLENDFHGHGQNEDRQQNLQLVGMKFFTEHSADLGAEYGAEEEEQGEKKIHGTV